MSTARVSDRLQSDNYYELSKSRVWMARGFQTLTVTVAVTHAVGDGTRFRRLGDAERKRKEQSRTGQQQQLVTWGNEGTNQSYASQTEPNPKSDLKFEVRQVFLTS